ncbi:MAG: OsmC family protein [Helicobacteraceae bacterium]|jgi:putative redox protein|nr:OsmC family protein [Helicobacteraceae bacterium]
MKVSLAQTGALTFEATTSRGIKFEINPKEHISPLEYFAIGAIACTASDIILLPQKQRKTASALSINAEFDRYESPPHRFTSIHIVYSFDSDGADLDAKRWVLSSLESYCTTINTLRGVAKIYYSIRHNGALIADRESIASGENEAAGLSAEPMENDACPS